MHEQANQPGSAKVSYDSVRGKVAVQWKRAGANVDLEVEVPPDTLAEIYVPGKDKPVEVTGGKHRFQGTMQ